ncbi:hypothetical protein V6N12_066881 [Hibiscus sabdariffa]|uniref:Uncharacterized protein n=1 Tax=Hibiscus sabdariffa TaxID=183260 RepID=A0ABR2C9V8_9ROSI
MRVSGSLVLLMFLTEDQRRSILDMDVESRMNNEAKVPSGKVEKPLEVQEEGDSSRVNGHLVDASMEGSVVPNTVSLEVDLASQIDRMWEGNMREDWRVGMYCQCLKLVE